MSPQYIQTLIARLENNERQIVSDNTLDEISKYFPDVSDCIATCFNKKRVGILDTYVAWIGYKNQPIDLTYDNDLNCYGSYGSL